MKNKLLDQRLFTPFSIQLIAVLALTECMRSALLLAVLPLFIVKYIGLAKTISGAALSVHYLMDNLLRSPAGWVVDRFGQRKVLLCGLAVAIASLWGLHSARTAWTIIAWAGLLGVGTSPIWPSVISGCTATATDKDRASIMGIIFMAWLSGAGIGIVGANQLLGASYTPVFIGMAIAAALALIATALLRKSARSVGSAPPFRIASYMKDLLRDLGGIKQLFPGMFAQTFALGLLIPILSIYAEEVLGLTTRTYSFILLIAGAVVFVLLLPIGRLVDRYGPKRFLISGFVLAGSLLSILPLARQLHFVIIGIAVLAGAYALILPSWNALLDRAISPERKGTIWGVFMTVEGLGTAAGPVVSGRLYDAFGPAAPFYASASVIGAMSVLYWLLPIGRVKNAQ